MDNVHATHKNLYVYKTAKLLTIDLITYFNKEKFRKRHDFLILQLFRATSSIGANIAEGYGRYYTKSYRHFLSIARGSCFEVEYWLDIIAEVESVDTLKITQFQKENLAIIKMLTTMMKKLE